MHKYLIILISFLAATSCRYSFELDTYGLEQRIAVRSVIGAEDSTSILVHKALPITEIGNEDTYMDNAAVILKCNGKEVETSSVRLDKTGFRFDAGVFKHGDRIEIIAGADGIETATAVTTIPEKFPDFEVDLKVVENGIRHLNIAYEDNPETEDYYGVSVLRQVVLNATPDVLLPESPIWPISYGEGLTLDPNAYSPVFTLWNGLSLFIWKDGDETDNTYDIFFRHDYENYQIKERQVKCRLFKLSEELYRTILAEYDLSDSPFASLGLSSPSFTYTNIKNGVGWFCSYSTIDSEWISDPQEDL